MEVKRSELFRAVDLTTEEQEPVQYVGVYIMRWHDRPKDPTVGFVRLDSEDVIVD